jgi:hypothetical protein
VFIESFEQRIGEFRIRLELAACTVTSGVVIQINDNSLLDANLSGCQHVSIVKQGFVFDSAFLVSDAVFGYADFELFADREDERPSVFAGGRCRSKA